VRRNSLVIIRDILVNCQKPIKINRLLTKANLSYVNWKKYEKKLLEHNLIFHEDSFYLISPEGLKRLREMEEFIRLFPMS